MIHNVNTVAIFVIFFIHFICMCVSVCVCVCMYSSRGMCRVCVLAPPLLNFCTVATACPSMFLS